MSRKVKARPGRSLASLRRQRLVRLTNDVARVFVHDHGYHQLLDALHVARAVPEAPCNVGNGSDLR
jgi:hypothetical protein